MQFAQFYHVSTGYVEGSIPPRFDEAHKKPVPACGSDSVAVFDGRWSIYHCELEALKICKARGFIGFTIERGPCFTESKIVKKLRIV